MPPPPWKWQPEQLYQLNSRSPSAMRLRVAFIVRYVRVLRRGRSAAGEQG